VSLLRGDSNNIQYTSCVLCTIIYYLLSDIFFGIFKLFLLTICLLDELVSLTISVMINRIYFFTVTVASIIKFQPG
jgi:hypothetical protein